MVVVKLTLQTDYALRILIVLAGRPSEVISVEEISNRFGASKNHFTKTAQVLADGGFIKTVRGRAGGLCLAMAPENIGIGKVVRHVEPNFDIAECFAADQSKVCDLLPGCRLKGLLASASHAFLAELDQSTLAQLVDK